MSEAARGRPAEAQRGGEPYCCACYTARDDDLARQDLSHLRRLGFRLRDHGPAEHAADPAADGSLAGAALVMAFLSPHAVRSTALCAQLERALSEGKPVLAVHVAKTNLPAGLKLTLGSIQAVLRWQLEADEYHRKLLEALPAALRDETPAESTHHAARLIRLSELAALQQQRALTRDELLEAAAHLRAVGDEDRALQAAAAAARLADP